MTLLTGNNKRVTVWGSPFPFPIHSLAQCHPCTHPWYIPLSPLLNNIHPFVCPPVPTPLPAPHPRSPLSSSETPSPHSATNNGTPSPDSPRSHIFPSYVMLLLSGSVHAAVLWRHTITTHSTVYPQISLLFSLIDLSITLNWTSRSDFRFPIQSQ
jgi:hypothetical protein